MKVFFCSKHNMNMTKLVCICCTLLICIGCSAKLYDGPRLPKSKLAGLIGGKPVIVEDGEYRGYRIIWNKVTIDGFEKPFIASYVPAGKRVFTVEYYVDRATIRDGDKILTASGVLASGNCTMVANLRPQFHYNVVAWGNTVCVVEVGEESIWSIRATSTREPIISLCHIHPVTGDGRPLWGTP